MTLPLAASAGLAAGLVFRAGGPRAVVGGGLALAASLSLLGAEGSRSSADAGGRRLAGWLLAAVLAGGCFGSLLFLARRAPVRLAALPPLAAAFAGVLAWVPAVLAERGRVARELGEEVALGIVPAEDVPALASPWRRLREARFGRPDERREYVRSALLLAVARHQQRRRSGQAERLRQLEVLSHRTRLRRAVEVRSGRAVAAELDALG